MRRNEKQRERQRISEEQTKSVQSLERKPYEPPAIIEETSIEPTQGEYISREEQLERWLDGESVHNIATDECTPDFSCCHPLLQADRITRYKFCDAWNEQKDDVVMAMTMGFCERHHSFLEVEGMIDDER